MGRRDGGDRRQELLHRFKQRQEVCQSYGVSGTHPHPFQGNSFFSKVAQLRDSAVDALIKQHLKDEDTMADGDQVQVKARGRSLLFHAAKVPQLIPITFPEFTLDSGERRAEYTFMVVATPKRGTALTLELTDAVLDWAKAAIEWCWGGGKRRADNASDLPQLEHAECKWRRRGSQGDAVYCRYRTAEGKWKTHSLTPAKSDDEQTYLALVREAEQKVKAVFDANHVPEPQETEGED